MTLNDKFSYLVLDDPYIFMGKEDAKKCQLIAQEFAIEFAEWLFKNYDGIKSIKEQLEIFKKEKGL
jgi:hypothetical protein